MKVVYKYGILSDIVKLPADCQILHIGTQRDEGLFAWVLCDPNNTQLVDSLRVVETGHSLTEDEFSQCGEFLGTFKLVNDRLVVHVWELNRHLNLTT